MTRQFGSPAARFLLVFGAFAVALLTGCSQPKPPPQAQSARPVVAPPVISPQQPVALSEIHREGGEAERIWHLRAALNVAALQCSRAGYPGIIKDYNQFLARHRTALAESYASEQARFQQTSGKKWQAAMDRHMTQLYNHWAWPPAQQRFCANASEIARRAAAIAPADFAAYAPRALSTVDQPIALTRGSSIRLVTAPSNVMAQISATAAKPAPKPKTVSAKK